MLDTWEDNFDNNQNLSLERCQLVSYDPHEVFEDAVRFKSTQQDRMQFGEVRRIEMTDLWGGSPKPKVLKLGECSAGTICMLNE